MLGNYTSPWMTEDLTIFKDAASKFMQAEFVPLADKWHDQGMVIAKLGTKPVKRACF